MSIKSIIYNTNTEIFIGNYTRKSKTKYSDFPEKTNKSERCKG